MRPRKAHTDAVSETGGEAVGTKSRRRDGRGWGPFSGAQLTVIVVAISVMVMLPVGAFAVATGSNVFVTDASTGHQQTVNNLGQALVTNKTLTNLIASGTTTVGAFATSPIFSNVNVRDYGSVRLFLSETGADPSTQIANIYSSVVPYVLDNFVMNTNDVTKLYLAPGANITLSVADNSVDPATYTWRLYGRAN